jgi:hypothetical protein
VSSELLGYVRAENAPVVRRTDDALHPPNAGPSVNESILPAANPEADKDMRRQMDALKQNRGPSLLEQHQQKIAEQQQKVNAGSDNPAERSTWNRFVHSLRKDEESFMLLALNVKFAEIAI